MQCVNQILLFLVLINRINIGLAQESTNDGFVLVKEDYNISIYERWITFPKSTPPIKAREVKGEFYIHSTIAEAFALIKDESRIKLWQKHVSEFNVYLTDDSTTWQEYSYHDVPWPVSDQDHFLQYRIHKGSTPDKLFITFETTTNPKLAPEREDVARMQLTGSWLLEKIGDRKIKATYRILSKPSNIPRIFTDPVIRSNLMSTIKHYIEILEKKH
jgi:hypothetical protein